MLLSKTPTYTVVLNNLAFGLSLCGSEVESWVVGFIPRFFLIIDVYVSYSPFLSEVNLIFLIGFWNLLVYVHLEESKIRLILDLASFSKR